MKLILGASWVQAIRSLPADQVAVTAWIATRDTTDGAISQRQIAELVGVSRRQVQAAIEALIQLGALVVTAGGDRSQPDRLQVADLHQVSTATTEIDGDPPPPRSRLLKKIGLSSASAVSRSTSDPPRDPPHDPSITDEDVSTSDPARDPARDPRSTPHGISDQAPRIGAGGASDGPIFRRTIGGIGDLSDPLLTGGGGGASPGSPPGTTPADPDPSGPRKRSCGANSATPDALALADALRDHVRQECPNGVIASLSGHAWASSPRRATWARAIDRLLRRGGADAARQSARAAIVRAAIAWIGTDQGTTDPRYRVVVLSADALVEKFDRILSKLPRHTAPQSAPAAAPVHGGERPVLRAPR